ncbi:MAG: hypothetical protein KDD76_03070 [Rickettsiales bacterium]|nr:hypothetical protein [Rickettsiales bacterium]
MHLFFLILFCLLSGHHALAFSQCICPEEPPSIDEAYRQAFGVFTGTVIDIDQEYRPYRSKIRFAVEQSWKGVTYPEVSVYTSNHDAYSLIKQGITCGYSFRKGERYLVFSYRDHRQHGPAYVSTCSRTAPITKAEEDIQRLGLPVHDFRKGDHLPGFLEQNP